MGSNFWCKECKHVWKSKKHKGRPSVCPRCNSKRIVYDCINNLAYGWIIGITGIVFLIWSLFSSDKYVDVIGMIGGLIGVPILLLVLLVSLTEHKKNKRILKQFEK